MDDPVLAMLNILTRLHGHICEIKQKYIRHEEIRLYEDFTFTSKRDTRHRGRIWNGLLRFLLLKEIFE